MTDPADPAGPVALVTGAGHGIGRATVETLRSRGVRVLAADLDLAAAEPLTADDGVLAGRLDVTDPASVEACVADCVDRFGRLDHLICTAGGDTGTPGFLDATDADWQRLLDLNLYGVVRCVRAAVPRMSDGGAVAIVGSVNGLAAWSGEPYSAAKAGLVNLTQQLAAAFGPRGIRVNLVAPGTVRTRVWDGRDADLERLSRLYPLRRIGEPADIANALAFLCSPEAAWITGVTLPVDGGASTGPRFLLDQLPPTRP